MECNRGTVNPSHVAAVHPLKISIAVLFRKERLIWRKAYLPLRMGRKGRDLDDSPRRQLYRVIGVCGGEKKTVENRVRTFSPSTPFTLETWTRSGIAVDTKNSRWNVGIFWPCRRVPLSVATIPRQCVFAIPVRRGTIGGVRDGRPIIGRADPGGGAASPAFCVALPAVRPEERQESWLTIFSV